MPWRYAFQWKEEFKYWDLNDIDIGGHKPCRPQMKKTMSYTILATHNVDISHTEVDSE